MLVSGTTRELVKLDGAVTMDFKTTGDLNELRASPRLRHLPARKPRVSPRTRKARDGARRTIAREYLRQRAVAR